MSTAVMERPERNEVVAYMPVMSVQQAIQRFRALQEFRAEMKEGHDYGTVPGSSKPTLLKPGAEKLCTFFGLSVPEPVIVEKIEDWTGREYGEPFFYYLIRQDLERNGKVVASQMGSCNSMESKYRYRWVPEHEIPAGMPASSLKKRSGALWEPDFAIQKGETGGKYGKPAEYWKQFRDAIQARQATRVDKVSRNGKLIVGWEIDGTLFRVPNPDICDMVNTILKMSQKRAIVAATLIAVNASEYFTQDIEDVAEHEPAEQARETEPRQPVQEKVQEQVQQPKQEYLHPAQVEELYKLIRATGTDEKKFCERYKIASVAELHLRDLPDALELLRRKQQLVTLQKELRDLAASVGESEENIVHYFNKPITAMTPEELKILIGKLKEALKIPAPVANGTGQAAESEIAF